MHFIRPLNVLLYALVVVVLLGGGAFLVYGHLLGRPGSMVLPSAGDALHRVPVWMGDGDDVRILMRPCHQWPEADRANDALLSAQLFPGGDGARFFVVWIFNYAHEGEISYDRDVSPVRLEAEGGRVVTPLDLPAAVNAASLRPDVLLGLRILHANERRIVIPAGTYRRILVAVQADSPLPALEKASLLGLTLGRRDVVRSRLEDYLADPGTRTALLPGGS